MLMRRIGQVRGSRSTGQIEKMLVIGLGGVLVLLTQTPLFAALRAGTRPADSRPAAASAPTSPPQPTTAPVQAAAPASPPEEPPPAAEPPRASLVDPPSYRVVAGGAGANLRGAPTTSGPVLQRVRDGAILTNLDEQRTGDGQLWRRVADGSTEGWVAAELLVPGP
jgi:hypothetical protein